MTRTVCEHSGVEFDTKDPYAKGYEKGYQKGYNDGYLEALELWQGKIQKLLGQLSLEVEMARSKVRKKTTLMNEWYKQYQKY